MSEVQLPRFRDSRLLEQALTHRSAINERRGAIHNERLEFLGDAVIELVVSDFLYKSYPKNSEGELTAARTALVRTETLASVAIRLDLHHRLKMSKGEERVGGNANQSLLADTFEAVVGAIYLDSGLPRVKEFIEKTLLVDAAETIEKAKKLDTKSKFQEIVQAKGFPSPIYRIIKKEGPDHNRTFTARVFVAGRALGTGKGRSKQEAEQAAARASFGLV